MNLLHADQLSCLGCIPGTHLHGFPRRDPNPLLLPSCLVFLGFSLVPLGRSGLHPVFGIDSQTLGDPVDVIEIADDLDRDGDLFIGETLLTKQIEILFGHRAGTQGELGGEIAQSAVRRAERRLAIIVDQLVGCFVLLGLRTEVLCVRQGSVIAIVDIADQRARALTSIWPARLPEACRKPR